MAPRLRCRLSAAASRSTVVELIWKETTFSPQFCAHKYVTFAPGTDDQIIDRAGKPRIILGCGPIHSNPRASPCCPLRRRSACVETSELPVASQPVENLQRPARPPHLSAHGETSRCAHSARCSAANFLEPRTGLPRHKMFAGTRSGCSAIAASSGFQIDTLCRRVPDEWTRRSSSTVSLAKIILPAVFLVAGNERPMSRSQRHIVHVRQR